MRFSSPGEIIDDIEDSSIIKAWYSKVNDHFFTDLLNVTSLP